MGCLLKPAPEGHRGGICTWGVTSDQHPSGTEHECTREASPQAPLPPPALPQEEQQAPPSALRVRPGPPACGLRFPATPAALARPPPSPLSAAWHHGRCSLCSVRRSLLYAGPLQRKKLPLPSASAEPRVRCRRGSARGRGAAGTEAAEGR